MEEEKPGVAAAPPPPAEEEEEEEPQQPKPSLFPLFPASDASRSCSQPQLPSVPQWLSNSSFTADLALIGDSVSKLNPPYSLAHRNPKQTQNKKKSRKRNGSNQRLRLPMSFSNLPRNLTEPLGRKEAIRRRRRRRSGRGRSPEREERSTITTGRESPMFELGRVQSLPKIITSTRAAILITWLSGAFTSKHH
jgi:hypothetical protein